MDTLVFTPGTQSLGDASAHVTVAARAHAGRDGAEAKLCAACKNAEQPLAARSWHSCMMCKEPVHCAFDESVTARVRVHVVGGCRGGVRARL